MLLSLLLLRFVLTGQNALFVNGRVVTMDAAGAVAEAVAVRDGRIAAVGSTRALRAAYPGPVVDLEGKTMLPGFFAAHDHFPASGRLALLDVDLNSPPIGSMQSIEDIVDALKARAAKTPDGQWIVGRGYDDTLVRERRHPTRHDLDRASTRHPIYVIHSSGHLAAANSRALSIAKVTRSTPDPQGGVIRKDAAGEPDGVIEERHNIVGRHVPPFTLEQRLQAIRHAGQEYPSRGVTTTVIAGNSKTGVEDLKLAFSKGLIPIRIVTMLGAAAWVPASRQDAEAFVGNDDRLRLGAIKMFQDGSLQGFTGFLTAPYHTGKPDFRGYAARSRDELVQMVNRYHRGGFQIAIHGNGDAAIDDILSAYRQAQREYPRSDTRHRIEHCQTPREDQIDAMRDLGISPSFFVGHVYYWGDRHRDIFLGPVRAERISPLASALRRGLRFSVHNDTPVTPVNPLLLVWAAVTRTTRDGKVLGPAQRVSVLQALRSVTIDAAWQNFQEATRGSIERGKFADFVVLAENPLTVHPSRIKDIAILETIVGGRTVFRR